MKVGQSSSNLLTQLEDLTTFIKCMKEAKLDKYDVEFLHCEYKKQNEQELLIHSFQEQFAI